MCHVELVCVHDWCTDNGTVDTAVAVATETSAGADDDEIEVIRCICNIYRDEGLMIQCDSCEVTLLTCHIAYMSHTPR